MRSTMPALLGLCLTLVPVPSFAQSAPAQPAGTFLTIVSPTDQAYCSNLKQPLLLEGRCSPDIVSVKVQYRLRRGEEKSEQGMEQIVDTYELKKFVPGSGVFVYRIFQSLGNLDFGSNIYEVTGATASGGTVSATVQFYYNEYFGERAKPVIYLYPRERSEVIVDVAPRDGLTVTIPEKGPRWRVFASPDGAIVNEADGRSYPYLFWEGPDRGARFDPPSGFVVARENLGAFFRDKLAVLGLRGAEIDDFVAFWLPKLSAEPWYLIAFTPRAELDAAAPLSVSPAPDSVIRVFFDHRGLEGPISLPEQRLERAERSGFAVVEWGGRRYAGE